VWYSEPAQKNKKQKEGCNLNINSKGGIFFCVLCSAFRHLAERRKAPLKMNYSNETVAKPDGAYSTAEAASRQEAVYGFIKMKLKTRNNAPHNINFGHPELTAAVSYGNPHEGSSIKYVVTQGEELLLTALQLE